MSWPKIVVVVLNWNGEQVLPACLRSLLQMDYPEKHVVVVDNASADDSASQVSRDFPEVEVIVNDRNLGFAEGNNVGLKRGFDLSADYAVLLNNDTEVAIDFLREMANVAVANPSVGIVGPSIYYHDSPGVFWSAGGSIDWSRGITRMMELDQEDRGQIGLAARPVDFVTGCALMISKSAYESVGGLDARFFTYYEEAEWCVRVSRGGYSIMQAPLAKVWHKISPNDREASPRVHYYMTRNRLLFLRLVRAGWSAWLHTLWDYARTLAAWTLKPRWRSKASQRKAMLRAILDYGRGRLGGKVEAL
jgi:GT2 family glycosyltransferase